MNDSELRRELERLHAETYGWALCCCARDRARAEDVVQAAYLKVLQGKARYDGRSALRTWLFAVVRRTAAEERRRDLLRRLRLRRYSSYESAAGARGPAEPADAELCRTESQERLRHAFREALASLPRRQQQVLQLVFYHELTLAEAAGAMGVSLGSARTHYDRGKRAVRERVGREQVGLAGAEPCEQEETEGEPEEGSDATEPRSRTEPRTRAGAGNENRGAVPGVVC